MQPSLRALVTGATAALVVSASFALSASATPLTGASMNWSIQETGQNGTANMLNLATCNSTDVGGDCTLNNWTPGHGLYTVNSWTSAWDTDPFVTNNLNVTNNSLSTMIFDVTVTSPVGLTGPFTDMSGSIGITLTNTAGTVLLDSFLSNAIYVAIIDGSPVFPLFPAPYALSCTGQFCSTTDSDDFGVFPNSPVVGPQANATIGIRVQFQLSPGDSAGITSVFNIEPQPVPEPTPASLLVLGLVALVAARRGRA